MKTKYAFILGIAASVVFVALIALLSPGLDSFRQTLLPDSGPAWYYWKLPSVSFWSTVTMWVFYTAHQLLCWYFIFKLQCEKSGLRKDVISKYNAALLIVNAAFVILHLIQTQLFMTRSRSLFQFRRRSIPSLSCWFSCSFCSTSGVACFSAKKYRCRRRLFPALQRRTAITSRGRSSTPCGFIRWKARSHLFGFFYMFLLMLQMSLAYTKVHTNIRWVTLLEVFVTLHGTVVALEAGQKLWSMFLFGFAMMFIVMQMYGVVWFKAQRIAFTALYLAMAVLVYSGVLGTDKQISEIHQIFWIPVILYGLVFAITGLYFIAMKLLVKKKPKETAPSAKI